MKFPNPFRAIAAFFRTVFHRGPRLVTEEVKQARMSACYTCPFFEVEYKQCYKCSCFLSLKWQLSSEGCPIKKW